MFPKREMYFVLIVLAISLALNIVLSLNLDWYVDRYFPNPSDRNITERSIIMEIERSGSNRSTLLLHTHPYVVHLNDRKCVVFALRDGVIGESTAYCYTLFDETLIERPEGFI